MTQRISMVLQKLIELNALGKKMSLIEMDLMLDYTRVLYADLTEARATIDRKAILPRDEPTLDELANAYAEKEEEEEQMIQSPPPAPVTTEPAPRPVQQQHHVKHHAHMHPAHTPLSTQISINDKYLLLSSLFNNNSGAYESAIAQLSAMPDVRSAEIWMDAQDWGKDEIAAQLLRGIVKQHFG